MEPFRSGDIVLARTHAGSRKPGTVYRVKFYGLFSIMQNARFTRTPDTVKN